MPAPAPVDGRPWIVLLRSSAFFGSAGPLESALARRVNVVPLAIHSREWIAARGLVASVTRRWLRNQRRLAIDLRPWTEPRAPADIDLVLVADPLPFRPRFPGYDGRRGLLALDPQFPANRARHAALLEEESYDVVLCSQRDYLPFYRDLGVDRVAWLPHAAEPGYSPADRGPRPWDIAFAGQEYGDRRELLDRLARQFQVHRATAFLHDLGETYGRSKIVFNRAWKGEVNLRTFEATAAGALLLTDRVANGLDDLFRFGDEIVVYEDAEELVDLAAEYLQDETKREAVAGRGRDRCLRDHTYDVRADQLLEATGLAPASSARDSETPR